VITIVENLAYGAVQGADLIADIAFPSGRTALPAVISIHGGRWIRGSRFDDGKQGRPDNGVIDLHQWAAAGYFAMRIDYRLASCTPAPACFQDAMCAVRWIHAHTTEYRIDDDQIFLVGQSAGGHLAALAATLGPDGYERSGGWEDARSDFMAAMSLAGAYDLINLDWGSGWRPAGIPEKIAVPMRLP
jgi:acetyl esterase/lipase